MGQNPKELAPYESVRHFFGAELRRWREQRQLSQSRLGQLVSFDGSLIGKTEKAERMPSLELAKACDEVLATGGALARLWPLVDQERQRTETAGRMADQPAQGPVPGSQPVAGVYGGDRPAAGLGTVPVLAPGTVSADVCVVPVLTWDGKVVFVPLDRRALLIAAGAAGGAFIAGDILGVDWDRLGGAIRAPQQADDAEVPARIGMADVARIRDATRELARLEAKVGGAAARYVALGELRAATRLKESSMTPQVRQEWTAATAYLANLAGWVTFDAGLHGQARELFEVALGAARESGDNGLLARVADEFATLELYVGDTVSVFDLVCLAQSVAGTLPASVRACVELSAANAYARVPDARACAGHIRLAEDHYARADLAGDPDWIQYFTPDMVENDIAAALYRLALESGQRDERVFDRLWAAMDRLPADQARAKAKSGARLAALLYRDGQVGDAAPVATLAVDLASTVRSARLADALRVMAGAAQPYLQDAQTAAVLGRASRLLRTLHTHA